MFHWGGLSCSCKQSALALALGIKALALAFILMALLTSLGEVDEFIIFWCEIFSGFCTPNVIKIG